MRAEGEREDFDLVSSWSESLRAGMSSSEPPEPSAVEGTHGQTQVSRAAERWRSSVIDHAALQVSDPILSRSFYSAVLAPLGFSLVRALDDGSAGFGPHGPGEFWIRPGRPSTGAHIAFAAPTRASVDAFHAAALAHGARDHGAPGLRPEYHSHYYAAFVLDPDGHNIEAVIHTARA
jgi:catechol 2,3-dioxygenase-like lactoylglutathione lyase family enzyme